MCVDVLIAERVSLAGDEEANNKAEEAQNGAEDLNDENLDESVHMGRLISTKRSEA
jgi:hypothetical protein